MGKRPSIVLVCIFFSFCALSAKAQSNALLWSEITVYLDTLTFRTTGDLQVSFADPAPEGTLVLRDEVTFQDILVGPRWFPPGTSNGPDCKYFSIGPNEENAIRQSWSLASTGSGDLRIGIFAGVRCPARGPAGCHRSRAG